MKWSDIAWKTPSGIYDQITGMPFIRELIDGSLDREKFKFYISQDALYLESFSRALSLIAARAHRKDHMLDFIRFAEGAIVVESELHRTYFDALGIPENPQPSPACHHYISFLNSTAALAQLEVAMAAVLPCFWIYKEVGDHIYAHQQRNDNPYKKWIDTYAGEEFGAIVGKAIRICDDVALTCTEEQRKMMSDAFVTSCRLEWLFWDSAWRLERWQV
jgi:thiaminase/transcriptional activator TenA